MVSKHDPKKKRNYHTINQFKGASLLNEKGHRKHPLLALLCRIPRHDTVRLQGGFLRPVSLICDKHPQNNDVIFHPLHPCLPEIMTELQRTACHPREECVEVAKEHPESTSSFFRPRCISVHRCGGCCNHEGQECVSTSLDSLILCNSPPTPQLLQISPLEQNPSIITLTFVNHTSCDCQPKESLHTIRRRLLDAALLALCGPSKVLNREQCKCMCQNGLTEASCGPGQVLNDTSCQCACKQQPDPGVCPPNQTWDPERCGCVCRTDCPADQPRDPGTCQCQCRDGPQTCRLQRKMFRQETCSCYRPPFRISPKPSQLPQPAARQPQTRTSNREGWWLSRNH
uniref:Vascular endothelial growth factor C-like n=1 Tax=Scleropages formosus TaxID=113540 RepID=A0A8C9TGR6_SCLFO